jgi:hypothetical protein
MDFDLAAFSFQVPITPSAPNIPMAVTAAPMNTLRKMFRISV